MRRTPFSFRYLIAAASMISFLVNCSTFSYCWSSSYSVTSCRSVSAVKSNFLIYLLFEPNYCAATTVITSLPSSTEPSLPPLDLEWVYHTYSGPVNISVAQVLVDVSIKLTVFVISLTESTQRMSRLYNLALESWKSIVWSKLRVEYHWPQHPFWPWLLLRIDLYLFYLLLCA